MCISPTPLVPSKIATASLAFSLLLIHPAILAEAPPVDSNDASLSSFKVLESREVIQPDGHRVIFNRVEPPVTPLQPVAAVANAASQIPSEAAQPLKPMRMLVVSCTVYPGPITELRWGTGDTKHHAISNVDFRDVAGIGHFETADTVHGVFLGIGTDKAEARAANQPALPSLTAFTGSHAQYLLLPADEEPVQNDADLSAMDALHAFYDANKDALKQQRSEREAENLRRQQEQALRQNDPRPDTVIRYWPITNIQPRAGMEGQP